MELFWEEVNVVVKPGSSGEEAWGGRRTRQRQTPEQAQCVALGRAQREGDFGWGAWPKQLGKLGTEKPSPVT